MEFSKYLARMEQTPLKTVSIPDNMQIPADYNFGYQFTPNQNGQITKLWVINYSNRNQNVRVYDSRGTSWLVALFSHLRYLELN